MALMLPLLILIAWTISAAYLSVSMLGPQKSALLIQVGAVNGATRDAGELWRLITSQFLHVHLLHMLFNAAAILLLGRAVEREWGSVVLLLVVVVGGTVGQYFSVYFQPLLVSSGASQALMALCGFVIAIASRATWGRNVAAQAWAIERQTRTQRATGDVGQRHVRESQALSTRHWKQLNFDRMCT